MASNTYLTNVDEKRVDELIKQTELNATYFTNTTKQVVESYSKDLDELMTDLYQVLTEPESPSTNAIERYYAELTNMIYFLTERVEKLNVYSDMAKAAAKEVYNKAFLSSAVEKDEKGKSLRTVAENTAIAENSSQYESVVSSIYEHAYKTLKMKIDAASEMVSTLKYILRKRVSEMYLPAEVPGIVGKEI